MVQRLDYLQETASQTAGPYVHIGLAPGAAGFDIYATELGRDIAGPDAAGPRIRVEGMVYDGMGSPVKDVLLEVWQADAAGIYPHPDDPGAAAVAPGFRGFGRVIPDFDTGLWAFDTIKPGVVPGRMGRAQAPHISFWLVARGINIGLSTRMYFPDDTALHAADPVLMLVDQANRRASLVASRSAEGVYRFDIFLQGDRETVFLDV
jgi:protocatechuate 3,4-dioxygenase alpha subunit